MGRWDDFDAPRWDDLNPPRPDPEMQQRWNHYITTACHDTVYSALAAVEEHVDLDDGQREAVSGALRQAFADGWSACVAGLRS